jgi:hypothetical protein
MTAQEKDEFAADQKKVRAMLTVEEISEERDAFNKSVVALALAFKKRTGMEVDNVCFFYQRDVTEPVHAITKVSLPYNR